MNCNNCNQPMEEQDGKFYCTHCGTEFIPTETDAVSESSSEEISAPKTPEVPTVSEKTAGTERTEEKTEVSEDALPQKPSENPQSNSTNEELLKRIAYLEKKQKEFENKIQEDKDKQKKEEKVDAKGQMKPINEKKQESRVLPIVKKAVIGVLILGVIATIIVVCVFTTGLYGTYVNADNPDEYVSFSFGKYTMREDGTFGSDIVSNGSYSEKKKSGTITVVMKEKLSDTEKELAEGLLGTTEEDYISYVELKKVDGYKIIELDGDKYIRVSKKKSKKLIGKEATITFADKKTGKVYGSLSAINGKSFTVDGENPTADGYKFTGWNTNPDDPENGFAVSYYGVAWGDTTYYATWEHVHTLNSNCVCTECGTTAHNINSNYECENCGARINGKYLRSNDIIYFGTYPQTKVTDTSITDELNTAIDWATKKPSNGNNNGWTSYKYYISGSNNTDYMWYIDKEYNGDKYRGVYFTSYRPYWTTSSSSTDNSYQDDHGYSTSTIYWFKYEPIKWRILTESSGTATLLAELIIDSQQYDYDGSYSNNYADSTIRAWLNETFYNTSFTSAQQALIETVEVDNSANSTTDTENNITKATGYICDNTNDKVWLLSEQEVTTSTYGFGTCYTEDEARQKKTSDYAQCQGAYTYSGGSYDGNGGWWLRSPFYFDSDFARNVDDDGYADLYYDVSSTYYGVSPALVIRLS